MICVLELVPIDVVHFGERASYRTQTNEPKFGEIHEPERFKLSDIPGAPFFSRLHSE